MSNKKAITNIMETMGWTDGSFIPIANEENRQLMVSMEDLQLQKEKKSTVQQDLQIRTRKFQENLSLAKKNLSHNLKLLEAHRSQLSDEHHIFKVAEYEDGTLTKKLKELLNNTTELKIYDKSTKDDVAKSTEIVAKFSDKIKWSKDSLEEWQMALARGEGNNKMIVKYCKEDVVAAQQLETKRQGLQGILTKKRKVLVETNEEIRSLESVLDRTAQIYRQAHEERRNLVNTWKEAILSMRSRDNDIDKHSEKIQQNRTTIIRRNQELKEHEEFMERQIENNKEIERQTVELNGDFATTRQVLTDLNQHVSLLHNDLITLKKLSQCLSNNLQQRRVANRQAAKEISEKHQSVELVEEIIATLRRKYELFSNKSWNAQERLNSLDEMVELEETNLSKLTAENGRMGGAFFRFSKMFVDLRSDHKTQEMEIQSIESDIKSEKTNFKDLEAELIRQTEIIYKLELKTTFMEYRIAKMQGGASNVDPEIVSRLQEMEKAAEDKKFKCDLVKKQILKIEDDMRLLTGTICTSNSELESINSRLQGKLLEYEGGMKELTTKTLSNQEQLVDLSVLKMRVHQLEQMLSEQKDKVFNLQHHQANLELAMHERMLEIETRKDILRQKIKHLDEELTQLRADIGERVFKIHAIQARYENTSALLGRNEDGSLVTATQIKIETAQEKQMLLRDGNDLNERVIRAEKDIEAIENTLVLLNYSNNTYKKSMEPIKEDNKEMCDLNEVTEKYSKIQCEIKRSRSQIVSKNLNLQTLYEKECEVEKGLEYMRKIRLENNDQLMKLHKEILEQKSKMERAQRELKLARKTSKLKMDDFNLFYAFEKELKLKELEFKNNSALQQLADMVDSTTSMGLVVSKYLFEKGLTIPQPTKCRSVTGSQRNASEGSEASKWSPRISQFSFGFERDSLSMTQASTPRQGDTFTPAIVTLDFLGDCSAKSTSRSSMTGKSQRFTKGLSSKH